jgi:polysaccharide export outer membrane protein
MKRLLLIVMAGLALVGPALPTGQDAAAAQSATATAPANDQSTSPARPGVFTLGPGDKIRVTVFGELSVNGEYTVGPDGAVSFPLIGAVEARGRTVAELRDALTKKLAAGYILDPRVSIDVLNFRPFYILGEVNRPGQYPYADGLSVAQAVATAGGYTYRARTNRVFIRRADEAVEAEMSLKHGRQIWVMPGDTVRVGERYF